MRLNRASRRVDALRPLQPILQPFLHGVRVFAGTLVRDAVPKLLESEGRALKFRNVAASEYPTVLKRKLVETVQRLETTEFGVEQEEIADVLELLRPSSTCATTTASRCAPSRKENGGSAAGSSGVSSWKKSRVSRQRSRVAQRGGAACIPHAEVA